MSPTVTAPADVAMVGSVLGVTVVVMAVAVVFVVVLAVVVVLGFV